MKKNILTLMCLGLMTSIFGQESSEGVTAPFSPAFINYLNTENSPGESLVPIPYTISFDNLPKTRGALILPSRFDLRETHLLTAPRAQGVVNTCWAFATMDAIQSVWARMGLSTTDYSVENLANCHGYDKLKNGYGNASMAMAYLSRFSGPVYETSDPYVDSTTGTCNSMTASDKVALVSEGLYLPKDVQTIKQMVYRYGGVFTAMYNMGLVSYYNPSTYATFIKDSIAGMVLNHAVTIVGWNDTMTVSIQSKSSPSKPGAWIIKNTVGTSKYDSGYFYASYEDYFIGSQAVVYPQRIEKERIDTVFYYDKLGHIKNYGNAARDSASAIVKYNSPQKKLITAIGTFTNAASSVLDVEVYQTKTGDTLSGLLAQKIGVLCEYPGYHTVELPVYVQGDFYVKIKYRTPGYKYPIPIEISASNLATVTVQPIGLQWVRLKETDTLRTVGLASRLFNLCVKVYAQNVTSQPLFQTAKNRYCLMDTVIYKNKSEGSYDSYSWNFGEGATPLTATTDSLTDSVKVVYTTAGMKKVSLYATSGTVTDTITKANAVEVVSGVPLDLVVSSNQTPILIHKSKITVTPSGADTYHWAASSCFADTITKSIFSFVIGDSTEVFKITGIIGQCQATDSITVMPTDTCALYDDISTAKELSLGTKEGPFSNVCATWRTKEPHPIAADTCVSQSGWCPGEGVLNNSLWFKFTMPSTVDSVKIVTSGFDNQIALYDALSTGTAADIMSGDVSKYAILAANDDSSATQGAATIQPIKLTAGKTYWLQMDGSAGGATTDSAYVTVSGIVATATLLAETAQPVITNPVHDGTILISNAQRVTQVELVDLTGKSLKRLTYNSNPTLRIDVSSLQTGFYILQLQTDKGRTSYKILIE